MRLTHTAMPLLFTLLAFVLASLFGAAAAFAQTNPFGGGDGTEGDPYQISTIAHLNAIRDNSGSSGENYLDDHYILMNDLDFEDTDGNGADYVYSTASDAENAKGWLPIGHDTMPGDVSGVSAGYQGTVFSGSFSGGGNVILNLSISRLDENYVGLFGWTAGSVKNLGMEGVDVEGDVAQGGLAGFNVGTITSCYSTGRVSGVEGVGGLVGGCSEGTTITACYSTADVSGSTGVDVGGLVGTLAKGMITGCYSTGSVTGNSNVGGFIGGTFRGAITACYSTGSVTGNSNVGGFIGSEGWVRAAMSFWDTDTSGFTTSPGGDGVVGKTTVEMKALTGAEDSTGWGELSWHFGDSNQYPALRTHEEMPAGTQVQGRLICGQPSDHFQCPALNFGSMTIDDQTYTENAVIPALALPEAVAGGTGVLTYTLTPNLPAGLSLDDSTRMLLGMPDMAQAATQYTYTVTDFAAPPQTATLTFMITVLADTSAPDFAGATIDDQTYTVNTAITALVLPSATDTGMVTYSLSPALPSGLTPAGDVTDVDSPPTISGIPDTTFATMTYTYTAKDNAATPNTQTLMFMITVDDLPLVSIAAGTSSVTEGTAAEFTLTRVGDTTAALTVMVAVTGGDSFLSGAAPTEAVFDAGNATVTLSLATDDDDMDETDGMVTVTLTADVSNFRLGTDTATVDITDNDLPEVSIAAGTSSVTEGTAAEFTLTRVGITTEALTASVSVTDPGDFLSGAAPTQAVFGAGDATVILSLTTDDDDMDEAEGMVTVTVTEAVTSYRVDADNSSATVTVTDDDTPPPGTALSFLGTIADQTYTQNTAIMDLVLPEATGGMGPYMYALTPVPTGLMFDATSRTLSGTPTMAADPATTHTYTVTDTTPDTALTKTLTFTITVNAEATLTFSGTVPNQTYTQNTATMDLVLPVATGGMEPYMYALTPVPAGLMFDATSRTLSGTPTETTDPATTHTYTVTDSTTTALTKTLTFTITVNAEGSPMFSDPVPNQIYTQDTAITDLVLPAATGGMGALTYALIPVPAGLMFDTTSRTLSGTPTAATDTPTTHTYMVTDSTPDTALTASLTFTITVNEVVEPTLGIGSLGAAVHVYPNPAGDVLYIEFSGAREYGIALLTVTGQQVFGGQHAGGGTKKLDVSTLKGGVYFLKIEDSEGGSHIVRILR